MPPQISYPTSVSDPFICVSGYQELVPNLQIPVADVFTRAVARCTPELCLSSQSTSTQSLRDRPRCKVRCFYLILSGRRITHETSGNQRRRTFLMRVRR